MYLPVSLELRVWNLRCISTSGKANFIRLRGILAVMLYTDPGSGTLIWQLLSASGLMAAFYFARAKNWLSSKLRRKREHEEA